MAYLETSIVYLPSNIFPIFSLSVSAVNGFTKILLIIDLTSINPDNPPDYF